MNSSGDGVRRRRHSLGEVESVVEAYERSGLTRRQFCDDRGLKLHTLDAWRRRVAQARSGSADTIVPVELVGSRELRHKPVQARSAKPSGCLRVILPSGLRVEVSLASMGRNCVV